jgi:hypothetical protein
MNNITLADCTIPQTIPRSLHSAWYLAGAGSWPSPFTSKHSILQKKYKQIGTRYSLVDSEKVRGLRQ